MSRLLVLTRPGLAPGFQLAGVETYCAEDVEGAQELIGAWLETGEAGLLAIDDGLLAGMGPSFLKRLDASPSLAYLAIPAGEPLGREGSRKYRITQVIRRAVGVHITFRGTESEVGNE